MRIKVNDFLKGIAKAAVAEDVTALHRERRMLEDIHRYTATWNRYPDLLILLIDAIVCVLEDVSSYTFKNKITNEEVILAAEEHFGQQLEDITRWRWSEREKILEDYRLRVRMEFDVVVTIADIIKVTVAKDATKLDAIETSLKNVEARTGGDKNEDPRKFIEFVQAIQQLLGKKTYMH